MDRFDEEKYGERTVESLKDRYYSVARTILENRKMFDHPIIKSGYNYDQEMKRRTYLEKTMTKSFAELKEESNLFEMSENLNKKIEKNDSVMNQNLNELKAPNFSSPNQTNTQNNNTIQIPMGIDDGDNSINDSENKNNNNEANATEMPNSNFNPSNKINEEAFYEVNENNLTFEDYLKYNITRNDSFVYLRSQKMKHNLPVCEKIQERVDNYMTENNLEPQKLIPTAKVEMAYDNLRNNLILYTSLKKYLEKKEKEYNFLESKFKEYQNRKNPQMIMQNKSNLKSSNQIEIREEEDISSEQNPSINNDDNSINSEKEEISNSSINDSAANSNPQENNKQGDQGDKRKKIHRGTKIRKRKNMNEDEAPTNEEKDQSSKKKKKGFK